MNNKTLRFNKKSRRQIPNSRYTHAVDKYAIAPQRRLFHIPVVYLRADTLPNSFICNGLRIPNVDPEATRPLSTTYTLFKQHRGYTPKASHFGTSPVETHSRDASNRGRFRPILILSPRQKWDRNRQSALNRVLPIFTCNKKAISFTLSRFDRNATAANTVYTSIPLHRTDLQETDR